jgi:16S rRNA (guanine527-N7)-methyltransferase
MLKRRNNSINIVGKSTLIDPWKSHILDSLQISSFIPKKNCSILDLGTGPGIPGLVLAMYDFTNVSLVDSNLKKISFVKTVCSKLNIKAKIYRKRIEMLTHIKSDFLISRALANLNKLFFYSQNFLTEKTVLIFLKGKTVKKEIADAQKIWKFQYKLKQSLSDKRGRIVVVRCLKKINV